jgi:phasin
MTDSRAKTVNTNLPAPLATDVMQTFRATAESGLATAKEALEKMNVVMAEQLLLISNSYSTAFKGVQEYNTKVMEFALSNSEASFDFAKSLAGVKTPSDFIEFSTEHSRKQFETLADQTKILAALAQEVALATARPVKAGTAKTEFEASRG